MTAPGQRHQQQYLGVLLLCSCGERFTSEIGYDVDDALANAEIRHAVHEAESSTPLP